jgi:Protein of unknown function (DUF3501)
VTTPVNTDLLTLNDIADVRAYERERDAFRDHIISVKAVRRVHIGTLISLVFENRDTMRFQVQEMVRAEKILTDEGIQAELDVYNPLISRGDRLTATLFIECTTEEQMREWFPKLVGIERSVELRIGSGDDRVTVRCLPDAAHADLLTREDMTAAVHYVHFDVGVEMAALLAAGPADLAVVHPAYLELAELRDSTRSSLAADLSAMPSSSTS